MSGSDIRTGAWEGRWADFVDIARLFSPCVRISGGCGGRIPRGSLPGGYTGSWVIGRKVEARFLPLASCLLILVSGFLILVSGFWSPASRVFTDGKSCPSMRRAVGTRGGGDSGSPTVGTVGWDETSRCDGGSGCAAVLGYLLFVILGMRFSSTTHDLPSPIFKSPSRPWRLCGEFFRRGRNRDAGARRTGNGLGRGRPSHGNPPLSHPQSTIHHLRSPIPFASLR